MPILLPGVDPNDPTPGLIRALLFAQGAASGSGNNRPVVLIANKIAGTASVDGLGSAVNTLVGPITNEDEVVNRAGYRSEALWLYRAYNRVDSKAPLYMILVPEGGGATAASVIFTINFSAGSSNTTLTTLRFACLGEVIEVVCKVGDNQQTIAENLAAAIVDKFDWPIGAVAAIQGGGPAWQVTVTASNLGPRHTYVIRRLRTEFSIPSNITCVKGAVTVGATEDDFTNAYAALENAQMYYQVNPKTQPVDGDLTVTTGAIAALLTASDNGIGEHGAFMTSQSQPSPGKGGIAIFGLEGTAAQAQVVGATINNVRCAFFHAMVNDWTPGMVAAHCAAVKRYNEIAHPGANLTDWGNGDGQLFLIPDPFDKGDRLLPAEIVGDLNNGVSPIGFNNLGRSYMIRQITSRCLNGASNDYRAREGHIPSVGDYFWDSVRTSYSSQKKPFVASDPLPGQKPKENTDYPMTLKQIIFAEIDRLLNFAGGPVLDPSKEAEMKASVDTQLTQNKDGLAAVVDWRAVIHNLKGQFRLNEVGGAY